MKHKFNRTSKHMVRMALAIGDCPSLEEFREGQLTPEARQRHLRRSSKILREASLNKCDLVVFPELALPYEARKLLIKQTSKTKQIIVGGVEYDASKRNCAVIAMDGLVYEQAKRIASPYDIHDINLEDTVLVFQGTCIGNFAVIVCAEQIDGEAISALGENIDFVIVVARNRAISTFASMASGDAYRLYSCIVVANDVTCGKSLVASPKKGAGKVEWLSPIRGSTIVYVDFPLSEMRRGGGKFLKKISYRRQLPREVR